ncbi:hypothetical protein ACFLYO_04560 [Chloroflexota bacterium]
MRVVKVQCPFCLREFQSIEELTSHLVFANCQVQEQEIPLQSGRDPCSIVLRDTEVDNRQKAGHLDA